MQGNKINKVMKINQNDHKTDYNWVKTKLKLILKGVTSLPLFPKSIPHHKHISWNTPHPWLKGWGCYVFYLVFIYFDPLEV